MKRYFLEDGGQIVIGTDRQIRSLYGRMLRKGYIPTFCEFPKFRKFGMYGIAVDANGWFQIISSDTVVSLLVDGYIA